MSIRSTPNWPPYLWHHLVHAEKRGERLIYWRASFREGYERDRIVAGIEDACAECGVAGVIVYELFGAYDVLLRTWLPEGRSLKDLDTALTAELKPAGLDSWAHFEVDRMIRHWAFTSGTGEPLVQSITDLAEADIEAVEGSWPDVPPELLQRLSTDNLIAFLDEQTLERPGIKFAIELSSDADTEIRGLAEFEQHVLAVLDSAPRLRQRSLYSGSGFAHLLIMGRVDYKDFHVIHSDLISKLNTGVLSERFLARTLTHISGQRGYRIAREGLSAADVGRRSRIGSFLRRGLLLRNSTARRLEPGEEFGGRFEILRVLPVHDTARVYAVSDRYEDEIERTLTIFKPLDQDAAQREMAVLRRINHPNVVKAIWGDHDDSVCFLVTRRIDGKRLSEHEGGDEVWALGVAIGVLRALRAVHPDDPRITQLRAKGELEECEREELGRLCEKGLVHRGIQPDSIMICDDGQVILTDFEIALPPREPGMPPTSEYTAPDAGVGRWEPADDLFSCGVLLYELLLGAHPFPHRQPTSMATPTDPLTIREDLPRSLVEILMRACQPTRAYRYQSAAEMLADLERDRVELEDIGSNVRLAVSQLKQGTNRPGHKPIEEDARQGQELAVELARKLLREVANGPSSEDADTDLEG